MCLLVAAGCGGWSGSTSGPSPEQPDGRDPVVLNGGPDYFTSQVLDHVAPGQQFAFAVQVTNRAADAADVQKIELIDPTTGLATDGVAPFEGTPNPLGIGIAMNVTPEISQWRRGQAEWRLHRFAHDAGLDERRVARLRPPRADRRLL